MNKSKYVFAQLIEFLDSDKFRHLVDKYDGTLMKKIMIIDGGPRKTFNTASMLQKFAEGATSVSSEIEVKTVRLYGLDYKGCMSCMACKIKGKASNVCPWY